MTHLAKQNLPHWQHTSYLFMFAAARRIIHSTIHPVLLCCMKPRKLIEADLARAIARREKAHVALAALGKAPNDRRRSGLGFNATTSKHGAHGERRKAKNDRRKSHSDRRVADVPLPKGMRDRRRSHRRGTDASLSARQKVFADWQEADAAVEALLGALSKLKAAKSNA